jgi:hypothetical protein
MESGDQLALALALDLVVVHACSSPLGLLG